MPDDFKALYDELLQRSVIENLPQEILERFEVTSCLAFDDKKELYLVRGRQDGKKGVLRVTKGESMDDAAAEAGILRSLDHPAIPKVMGEWNESDRSFLLREYFEGTTLRELIRNQGVLKADMVMDITVGICDVLSYIHKQTPPVIHRDIKPDNIILTKDGGIKLIDFGIARKYLDGASKDTQIIGTEPYMAPEQYGSEQTDGRADIYSLGVVMVFLAAGQDGKRHLNKAFPYKNLVPVIKKCIKTDHNLRFQNAERLKKRILGIKRRVKQTVILCTVTCAAVAAAFSAGLYIGVQRGFDRGVDWLMSSPAVTIKQYTTEEQYEPVVFDSWYIDMAVRVFLNKEQYATIYLAEALRVDKIRIYGTYIDHPSLNTIVTKRHKENDRVEYWTDRGFNISERGDVSALNDITAFYYLRELTLSSQSIADLSPLSGMKLVRIDVSNNFIGNLLPLKDMVMLRELDVCQNPLNNLTPISRLLSLERLDISQTQVSYLKPLSGLTKLTQLELNYCDAKDLSPLQSLTRLKILGMRGVAAKDYDFLRNMEQLISLDVSDSGLNDVTKLPELDNLKTLVLSDNPISSVNGLARYGSLTSLSLDGIDITDIAGLSGLTHLNSLDISGTGVHDISVLADMPTLRELDISRTLVTDLTPLLERAEPITIRCSGILDEVIEQVRGVESIIIITE